jgi:excisionase family DNA binding protein
MSPPDRPFVSPKEFRELLGISERTMWRWLAQRKIPHIKVGGAVRIPTSTLDVLTKRAIENVDASAHLPEGFGLRRKYRRGA